MDLHETESFIQERVDEGVEPWIIYKQLSDEGVKVSTSLALLITKRSSITLLCESIKQESEQWLRTLGATEEQISEACFVE